MSALEFAIWFKPKAKRRPHGHSHKRIRRAWMKQHPICMVCLMRGINPRRSAELHHYAGVRGLLVNYRPFFIASCSPCHRWIHLHERAARKIGALCPASEWNHMPPTQ